MSNLGTISIGVKMPLIKQGDDIAKIVTDNLQLTGINYEDKDIIGITESIVARAEGNYVFVQDIADDITEKFGKNQIISVVWPIYSRNRFSMILKGIARAAKEVRLLLKYGKDEVGNDILNPFTNINIIDFYREVIESENCEAVIIQTNFKNDAYYTQETNNIIIATIHSRFDLKQEFSSKRNKIFTLDEICSTVTDKHGYNEEYGLLGSNKATDDTLKLFPRKKTCEDIIYRIQDIIKEQSGKSVEVLIYGDGCFKDPVGGIWEFADPVVSPAYTKGLDGTPNELKLKYIIDNENKSSDEIKQMISDKDNNLKGNMLSQGTTPRRYTDLIGSLCDLTSGSGDKGTPVVWIKNYFKNYSSN